MKKYYLNICLIILLLALLANSAFALRCGTALIQVGDTTMKVRIALKSKNCGEIIEKEYVGETENGTFNAKTKYYPSYSNTKGNYSSNTKKREKWFIRVKNEYGGSHNCYELIFVDSKLKEIGSFVKCD